MFRLGSGSNVDGALRWNIPGSARASGREILRSRGKPVISRGWVDPGSVKTVGDDGGASPRLFRRQSNSRTLSGRLSLNTPDASLGRNVSQRAMFPEIDSIYDDPTGDVVGGESLPKQRQFITVNLMQEEEVDGSDDDMEGKGVPLKVRGAPSEDTRSVKKTVRIRSADGPKRLYEKFCLSDLNVVPQGSSARNNHNTRSLWSGRSKGTSISSSWSGSHYSHCIVPGCHDITVSNTKSVVGPHSDLSSLLGEGPRPGTQKVQHRSAWYHIPGRYVTPKESYPKKRMQKTEQVKEIEAFISVKAQWYRRKHRESQEGQKGPVVHKETQGVSHWSKEYERHIVIYNNP
ncbi:hypothetical protein Btru_052534 [Bulinus truncatus]|nr:hypothetical protein Btru_052534 [Bulinus truncatus]